MNKGVDTPFLIGLWRQIRQSRGMPEHPPQESFEELRRRLAATPQEQQLADLRAQIAEARKNIGEMFRRTRQAEIAHELEETTARDTQADCESSHAA